MSTVQISQGVRKTKCNILNDMGKYSFKSHGHRQTVRLFFVKVGFYDDFEDNSGKPFYFDVKNRVQIGEDILTFFQNNEFADGTIKQYRAILKKFCNNRGKRYCLEEPIIFPDDFWREIYTERNRSGKAVPKEYLDPRLGGNPKLRRVIDNCESDPCILAKAAFTLLFCTGMRPNELVQIRESDIDWVNRLINLRAEICKSGYSRFVGFTTEAEGFLKEWLEMREGYLEKRRRKTSRISIFPFETGVLAGMWRKALVKATPSQHRNTGDVRDLARKVMVKNKSYIVHSMYTLRGNFQNKCLRAGVPESIIAVMVGHGIVGADTQARSYLYGKEMVADWYKKAEHELNVYERPVNISAIDELRNKMEEQNEELEKLKQLLKADEEWYERHEEYDGNDLKIVKKGLLEAVDFILGPPSKRETLKNYSGKKSGHFTSSTDKDTHLSMI